MRSSFTVFYSWQTYLLLTACIDAGLRNALRLYVSIDVRVWQKHLMGCQKFDCKSREAEVRDFSLQLQLAILKDDLIDAQGYFLQHSGLARGTSTGPHCHVAQKMERIKYFCCHNSRT